MLPPAFASAVAHSFLAGESSFDATHARLIRTFGQNWFFIRPLVHRYLAVFSSGMRPRHREVVWFLEHDRPFNRAWLRYSAELRIANWIAEPAQMHSASGVLVPTIETLGELAQWLSIHPNELDWFADLKGLSNKLDNTKLQHYRCTFIRKRGGGVRVIESPKPRLKELQRRILCEILDRVPAHEAAHGFVKGRSIVTFAAPHAAQSVVLRLDLENFFPGFAAPRVQAFFRWLGYPEAVADRLGGICTNAVPRRCWANCPAGVDVETWAAARTLHMHPHLPQGAPTSPALANLMSYRLDCRLAAFAQTSGARYTRYADDLAFSGKHDLAGQIDRFAAQAAAIANEEGFRVNFRKTRVMKQGVRQHVAGIVVNHEPSLKRAGLDRLEAILTNCVRFGPQEQNRSNHPDFRAHLAGRVGFVEMVNEKKGAQLRALFDGIHW